MTLNVELPDNQKGLIAALAKAKGVSVEEWARQALGDAIDAGLQSQRPVSDVIREM